MSVGLHCHDKGNSSDDRILTEHATEHQFNLILSQLSTPGGIRIANANIMVVPTKKPPHEVAPTTLAALLADRELSACRYLFTLYNSGLFFNDVRPSRCAVAEFSTSTFTFSRKKNISSCDIELDLRPWPLNF